MAVSMVVVSYYNQVEVALVDNLVEAFVGLMDILDNNFVAHSEEHLLIHLININVVS